MNQELIDRLDTFTRHYLIAALWADAPEERYFDLADIHPDSVTRAVEDCAKFQYANRDNLVVAYEEYVEMGMARHPDAGTPEACAGHDFWLTRQHHGVGFWDRGLSVGRALTEAAHEFAELDVMVDGGRVYIE